MYLKWRDNVHGTFLTYKKECLKSVELQNLPLCQQQSKLKLDSSSRWI